MNKIILSEDEINFFETLYKNYYCSICNYISTITFHKVDAEALTQDTFIIALEKISKLIHHPNPQGWLYQTTRNLSRDKMRSKQYRFEILTTDEELDQYPRTIPDSESIFDDLEEFLNKDECFLLKKHFKDGYKIIELACKYGVKQSTMNMRFSRIYKKLRKLKLFNVFMLLFISIYPY